MSPNVFESGEDRIEVHEYDSQAGCTQVIDLIEGFMFQMPPRELREFLDDHGYVYAGAGQ